MCGGAILAPLALGVASLFGGGRQQNQGVQSYAPEQQEILTPNPEPAVPEPQFGVDNSDTSTASNKKGKSALVINRNPGVAVGTRGSGVNVVGG